jgi:hypothetical protein
LACQWRIFWQLSVVSIKALWASIQHLARYELVSGEEKPDQQADADESPLNEDEDIATWMWGPGAVVLVILAVVLTYTQFEMSPLESLLALILSFCMSLVAIQATGATGMS